MILNTKNTGNEIAWEYLHVYINTFRSTCIFPNCHKICFFLYLQTISWKIINSSINRCKQFNKKWIANFKKIYTYFRSRETEMLAYKQENRCYSHLELGRSPRPNPGARIKYRSPPCDGNPLTWSSPLPHSVHVSKKLEFRTGVDDQIQVL